MPGQAPCPSRFARARARKPCGVGAHGAQDLHRDGPETLPPAPAVWNRDAGPVCAVA